MTAWNLASGGRGGDGKKQTEEVTGGELEKPLCDFIQDFFGKAARRRKPL
jgi:hypothetical protein